MIQDYNYNPISAIQFIDTENHLQKNKITINIQTVATTKRKRSSTMKTFTKAIPVMAAAVMMFSLPAVAAEGTMGHKTETALGAQKDECLIVAMNCGVDSISARVTRIERELSKGSDVYTKEELLKLERELKDASRIQKVFNNEFPPVAL
jgi:hypothetical protein